MRSDSLFPVKSQCVTISMEGTNDTITAESIRTGILRVVTWVHRNLFGEGGLLATMDDFISVLNLFFINVLACYTTAKQNAGLLFVEVFLAWKAKAHHLIQKSSNFFCGSNRDGKVAHRVAARYNAGFLHSSTISCFLNMSLLYESAVVFVTILLHVVCSMEQGRLHGALFFLITLVLIDVCPVCECLIALMWLVKRVAIRIIGGSHSKSYISLIVE
jgi:hypothetical protein